VAALDGWSRGGAWAGEGLADGRHQVPAPDLLTAVQAWFIML
jgi:hypothetical protein